MRKVKKVYMWASGVKTKWKGLAFSNGRQVGSTRANGRTIRNMELEFCNLKEETSIVASLWATSVKASVFTNGQTRENSKVGGTRINNTGWAFILLPNQPIPVLASGKWANVLFGSPMKNVIKFATEIWTTQISSLLKMWLQTSRKDSL